MRSPSSVLAPSAVPEAPCVCPECRSQVLDWLRQYERAVESQASARRGRNPDLQVALAKNVSQHLRHLRRSLAKGPGTVVFLARQLFEAVEVAAGETSAPEDDILVAEVATLTCEAAAAEEVKTSCG